MIFTALIDFRFYQDSKRQRTIPNDRSRSRWLLGYGHYSSGPHQLAILRDSKTKGKQLGGGLNQTFSLKVLFLNYKLEIC